EREREKRKEERSSCLKCIYHHAVLRLSLDLETYANPNPLREHLPLLSQPSKY
ncbi:unnamed protein product, partial [Musa textilis]